MAISYMFPFLVGTTAERTGGTFTNLQAGWLYIETDGKVIYRWNGSSWDLITEKDVAETLTGKTLTTPTINGIKKADVAKTVADTGYTLTAADYVVRVDASGGDTTLNLPTAVGIAGTEYHIFRTDILSSTTKLIIDASSTQTIDSNLTYILWPAEWIKIESDGANWQVLSRPVPTEIGYYFDKGSTTNRRYFATHPSSIVTSTTAPAVNTLWALPFIVSKTTKFDTISFRLTTNQTGNARCGIYRDNGNCYPGALWYDTGAIACATGTLKDTTITSTLQILQPGLYWLAWECDVASLQLKVLATFVNQLEIIGNIDQFQTGGSGYGYSVAHTFGSLPDPYTAAATALTASPGATVPIPAIGLRAI